MPYITLCDKGNAGHYTLALQSATRARHLNPNDPMNHRNLAKLHNATGTGHTYACFKLHVTYGELTCCDCRRCLLLSDSQPRGNSTREEVPVRPQTGYLHLQICGGADHRQRYYIRAAVDGIIAQREGVSGSCLHLYFIHW